MDYIEAALNTAYTGGIEALVDADLTENGNIRGRFLGGDGRVFAYQIDPEGVEFQESHEDSEWINDYYSAKLAVEGVEYHGDSAFEYWKGRNGDPVRVDGINCKSGTPCGGRCLPQGQKCRVGASGASGIALKQGPKVGKKAKAAGAAAAGAALSGALALMANRNKQKRLPGGKSNSPKALTGGGGSRALPPGGGQGLSPSMRAPINVKATTVR